MGLEQHRKEGRRNLGYAVVTVSDTRELATDRGGDFLAGSIEGGGHRVVHRSLCRDEPEQIQAAVRAAIAAEGVDLVLTTGGTGLTARDVTPESVAELCDREIPGFGELFRQLSYAEVGAATILSRALGCIVDKTVVLVLPGSPKALALAMDAIVLKEAGHMVSQVQR